MVMIKILIKTPSGYAKSTEYKLRPFLIGRKGKIHKILTNDLDNQILWIVDAQPRQYHKIIKNVTVYKTMISKIMQNKTIQKVAKITADQKKELNNMLTDQTEIDVIKEKDWEEIKKEFKEI
jgi:hypothetical protein